MIDEPDCCKNGREKRQEDVSKKLNRDGEGEEPGRTVKHLDVSAVRVG